MRFTRFPALVALALSAVLLTGCGDTPESLAAEQSAKAKSVFDILKSVKDKDSAIAAKAKLNGMKDEMQDLKKRIDALPGDGKEKVLAKVLEDMKTYADDFPKEVFRIMALGPDVQKELEGVESIFQEMN